MSEETNEILRKAFHEATAKHDAIMAEAKQARERYEELAVTIGELRKEQDACAEIFRPIQNRAAVFMAEAARFARALDGKTGEAKDYI